MGDTTVGHGGDASEGIIVAVGERGRWYEGEYVGYLAQVNEGLWQ